jgi:outer membrane protein insertion porin family
MLSLEDKSLMKSFNKLKKILSLLFLLAVNAVCLGQQVQLGNILGLTVEGNRTSEASVVKLSSGLREGQKLTFEGIQRAVRQLWALGIFSDIRVLQDRKTTEGVFLTIKVKEYPRLERVVIEGNKKIKKEDIEKEMGFFRGQVLNSSQIVKTKKQLLRTYAEKGYTLAEIETKTYESEEEGKTVLHLTINEGKKVQIKGINFFGNIVFDDGKLRKQMKKTKEDRWWRGADFDKKKFENDKDNILTFYRNNGYRDAEIVKDSVHRHLGTRGAVLLHRKDYI